jgi:hypothetical protein
MNRYIMIRRLRWPAILMLVGVIALLHQMGLISHPIHLFVPLLLILLGVLMLSERTFLSIDGYPPYPGAAYPGSSYSGPGEYPGAPYAPAGDPLAQAAPQPPAQPGTAIVPTGPHDLDINNQNGGR